MTAASLIRSLLSVAIRDAQAQSQVAGDRRACEDYGRLLAAILVEAAAAARDVGAPKSTILAAVEFAYADDDANSQAPNSPISASVH